MHRQKAIDLFMTTVAKAQLCVNRTCYAAEGNGKTELSAFLVILAVVSYCGRGCQFLIQRLLKTRYRFSTMYRNIALIAAIFVFCHQTSAVQIEVTVTEHKPCNATSCPSNWICADHPRGPRCICPPGKAGPNCEFDNPCLTENPIFCIHGFCRVTDTGAAKCVCRPGYHGVGCLYDIDECLEAPCESNELCVNFDGGHFCISRTQPESEPQIEAVKPSWYRGEPFRTILVVVFIVLVTICVVLTCALTIFVKCILKQNLIFPKRYSNRVSSRRGGIPRMQQL